MSNNIKKNFFIFIFFLVVASSSFLLSANAQAPYSAAQCNDPFDTSGAYTSEACVKFRLGIQNIDADTILVARDPNSFILVGFRIFLYIVIIITVARIVFIGIKIGADRYDSDKVKEDFVALIWTVAGMVLALGALGITFLVQDIVFGDRFEDKLVKCSDLPSTADPDLINRCNSNVKP